MDHPAKQSTHHQGDFFLLSIILSFLLVFQNNLWFYRGGVIFPQGAVSPMQQPSGQIPHAQLIPADSAMVEKATGGKKGRCNVYYYCCIFYCWAKWTPCGCYLVCADSGGPALPDTAIDHAVTNEFFDPPSPTAATPPRADIPPPSYNNNDDIDKVSPDDERHPPLQDIEDTHPDTPNQPVIFTLH